MQAAEFALADATMSAPNSEQRDSNKRAHSSSRLEDIMITGDAQAARAAADSGIEKVALFSVADGGFPSLSCALLDVVVVVVCKLAISASAMRVHCCDRSREAPFISEFEDVSVDVSGAAGAGIKFAHEIALWSIEKLKVNS